MCSHSAWGLHSQKNCIMVFASAIAIPSMLGSKLMLLVAMLVYTYVWGSGCLVYL